MINMKKISIDGINVFLEKENEFGQLCKKLEEKNFQLDDLEGWETEQELKIYDSDAFIEHAKKYYSEVPPDLIQTAAKLWFSAVYVIKIFFLEIGMHLVSHNAMKCFVKFTCKFHPDPAEIYDAWLSAEKLHSYSYGNKLFAKKEFPELISQIEWFSKEFPKISKDKVKEAINDRGFEKIPNVSYVYDKNGRTELSRTKYSVANKFY